MNVTQSELIELLDEIIDAIGQILARQCDLNEILLPSHAEILKKRIDGLKSKLEADKAELEKVRNAQKRKDELNRDNEERNQPAGDGRSEVDEGRTVQVPIYNNRYQLIGWIKSLGNGTVDILNSKSQLVAREYRGLTLNSRGQFVGRGRQGLIVLGGSVAA